MAFGIFRPKRRRADRQRLVMFQYATLAIRYGRKIAPCRAVKEPRYHRRCPIAVTLVSAEDKAEN